MQYSIFRSVTWWSSRGSYRKTYLRVRSRSERRYKIWLLWSLPGYRFPKWIPATLVIGGGFHTQARINRMQCYDMMTSWNGNIFRVNDHLCEEFTGPPVNSPHKGHWRGALMFSLICTRINGWVNNREAGDMRRHRAHYDVTVMNTQNPNSRIATILTACQYPTSNKHNLFDD